MAFLTNDKLTIVGAAGMIGSNMAQSALMMGLTRTSVCMTYSLPRVLLRRCARVVSMM